LRREGRKEKEKKRIINLGCHSRRVGSVNTPVLCCRLPARFAPSPLLCMRSPRWCAHRPPDVFGVPPLCNTYPRGEGGRKRRPPLFVPLRGNLNKVCTLSGENPLLKCLPYYPQPGLQTIPVCWPPPFFGKGAFCQWG